MRAGRGHPVWMVGWSIRPSSLVPGPHFFMSLIHVSFISLTLTNLRQPAPPAGLAQVLPGAEGDNQVHYLALTDSASVCC